MPVGEWSAGDPVEVLYDGADWYAATVKKRRDDGTERADMWGRDGKRKRVPPEEIRAAAAAPDSPQKREVWHAAGVMPAASV
eukprot:gene10952-16424_t